MGSFNDRVDNENANSAVFKTLQSISFVIDELLVSSLDYNRTLVIQVSKASNFMCLEIMDLPLACAENFERR